MIIKEIRNSRMQSTSIATAGQKYLRASGASNYAVRKGNAFKNGRSQESSHFIYSLQIFVQRIFK